MPKQYVCELCKKVFTQKIDFTRHQDKKSPCISLAEIQQISQNKQIKTDNKLSLINIFKGCLNILRDNEGLTGDKALRTMSYLLILKLLEPHFGGEIDIDNYEYDFDSHFEESVVDANKKRLLSIIRFTNLTTENEDNIPNLMKYAWDIILSVHPITKNIFLKSKGFDIQRKTTYKRLIEKLNSSELLNTDYDVLGNAYEEVIQDIMVGKVLGQFFTQPLIKKMMVKLINPEIHPDGKIDTCGDPTMGTGGFLITYLQYILEQAKLKNIKPDWEFIKTEGLYGKELEPDTYQLAVSNMLISSGHMFEQLERGDSIRQPITRKFDNILANPPFGIKGLKYDDLEIPKLLKNEYIPIKTDNAVSLFIQAIIYMLKINGKCAVVLPDGQDLFSKTNTTLVAIREYLIKTCDLKEIIYLPSGIFTYTSIKTCVFYFVKKREGMDVLETNIKVTKTQKETGRDYKFSKTYQTTKVKFYDYNPYEDVKNLLVEVPIEKIVSNSYSLNYAEYMKDETEAEQYEEGIVVKKLGEVCKFDIGGTPSRSKNEYYENGNNLWVSVRELNGGYIYDTKEKITDAGVQNSSVKLFAKDTVLFSFKLSIGKTAIVGNPLYTNEAIAGILSKNNDLLNNKYLYYYLTINDFSKLGSGILGNGSLNKKSLEQIKIPIPSLEKQQEIVKYLDFIYEKSIKTSNEKIAELKQLNELCLNNQKIFGENVVKTLGEVCKVNQGTYIKPDMKIQGEYPVYGGGNVSYYINQYNREDEIIVAKDGVSADCVRYEKNKFFLNHHGWTIICKDEITKKYMFYHLQSIQPELLSIAKGTAQLGINQENFYKLKISIPTLERQKEIVEYCEYNDTLVKQLEKEIENNKRLAQQFITSIVKSQVKEEAEEQDDTISVNTEAIAADEEQEVMPLVEDEPNPKIKKVVKKDVKKIVKKHVIVVEDEDNEEA
jgi:type I restriction-modification system DNA methylase subunit/restriction endonuclease S subunit